MFLFDTVSQYCKLFPARLKFRILNKNINDQTTPYPAHQDTLCTSRVLENISVNPEVVDRVCFIVSKHHTFSAIDDIDFQLLVEADFLVNSVEEEISLEGVEKFVEMNFKSESGRKVIGELFP